MDYFRTLTDSVKTALAEDIQTGDLTAGLIPETHQASANIICRDDAVICGRPWFDEVFKQIDATIDIDWQVKEGQKVSKNQLLCTLKGSAKNILTAERTALNFLQTLSATATVTAQYMLQLGATKTQLLDTRKTLPNLRMAQKYAVKCGGATNHRIGLFDAILIKENHIMAAGGIAQDVNNAKNQHPTITIEVETETLDEVMQALKAGADIIMLDNFSIEQVVQAIQLVKGQAKLEISGNVELQDLSKLAKTGVDFISTGAITKHIRAVDLSMRFEHHER